MDSLTLTLQNLQLFEGGHYLKEALGRASNTCSYLHLVPSTTEHIFTLYLVKHCFILHLMLKCTSAFFTYTCITLHITYTCITMSLVGFDLKFYAVFHEKGDHNDLTNYSAICLLNHACNVLAAVVLRRFKIDVELTLPN